MRSFPCLMISGCLVLFFLAPVFADNIIITGETTTRPTFEPTAIISRETIITGESTFRSTLEPTALISRETTSLSTLETRSLTTEASTTEPTATTPVEGASYKGIPWSTDFNTFKQIKSFGGNLSPFTAEFVRSTDDNDIALLLGIPVTPPSADSGQRVMFEFVPQKFASVYIEADDIYYIFYNGKFALTFSKINNSNFDLYRDTFFKKYKKTGSFTKKFAPANKKDCLLQASIFEKGKTTAFLIKNQLTSGKKSFVSSKLVYASTDLLAVIRKEIDDKLAAAKLSGEEREKQQLEKDLNKIE